jgi:hypothetical protein
MSSNNSDWQKWCYIFLSCTKKKTTQRGCFQTIFFLQLPACFKSSLKNRTRTKRLCHPLNRCAQCRISTGGIRATRRFRESAGALYDSMLCMVTVTEALLSEEWVATYGRNDAEPTVNGSRGRDTARAAPHSLFSQ